MYFSLPKHISCCFYNDHAYPLIVRIKNIAHRHFERTILPQQTLYFEASPNAVLEIRSPINATSIQADQISCQRLEAIPN